ncbi:uncharacterized protein LOC110603651 [Manihot esculenta]|uniref:Ultraviolet-B-repressible protein n=1 Tax=Manihot esculenta TaxID=3983 RepID=A0A2C9UBQ7_MANES|nr:uncharacterized protein LOC110603651 [Manihot esculenta]OAY26909.1 hypothetical protein MANES_16G084500v8 [Manihot esculenta]
MASVSMAISQALATQRGFNQLSDSKFFLQLLPVRPSKVGVSPNPKSRGRLQVHASLKEKAAAGLAAAVLTASVMTPEVAEAAGGSDISPSLKNFLLSIVAGGVVIGILFGAVIAVANFDPVKRT